MWDYKQSKRKAATEDDKKSAHVEGSCDIVICTSLGCDENGALHASQSHSTTSPQSTGKGARPKQSRSLRNNKDLQLVFFSVLCPPLKPMTSQCSQKIMFSYFFVEDVFSFITDTSNLYALQKRGDASVKTL